MVNHPNRSKRQGPACLNCGNPIKKSTERVNAEHEKPGSYIPKRDWAYNGNKEVVAKRYTWVDPVSGTHITEHTRFDAPDRWERRERRVSEVHVWDGESYGATAGFFCSGPCAQNFARAAAKAGYRRTRAA